ncbi:MAG TPA: hypothetical protein VHO72_02815, partial [Bacteroidales bacterium]|nr:hypothetical protein [Bacteroidales bacterium]
MLKLEKVNPYLLFLPFLFLYLLFVILFRDGSLVGDEGRYYFFAENLCNGFFSPPLPDINLDNGPGLPLILAFFVKLGISFQWARLLNPFFLYLAVVFIFKTCNLFLDFKKSLFLACFFACYYPFYQYLLILYSEIISIFLVT